MRRGRLWDMLVSRVCLQVQRKASLLLAYIEILWHFSLQILCLYFKFMPGVLFCSLSAFVTNHTTPTSYIIHLHGFHVQQSAEVRKKCLLHLKYGYLSQKISWIHYRRPLFTPQSHVMHDLLWMRTLYLTCFGLCNRNTHCNDRA